MSLPMSRFDRCCAILFKKPVVWAFMVCTGGATLMMVDGIAQTQMAQSQIPNRTISAAQSAAPGSVAANGPTSATPLETRADDAGR